MMNNTMSRKIELIDHRIDVSKLQEFAYDESCGSVNIFIGNVRNHNKNREVDKLFFEAYNPMAIKEMHKIADEMQLRWPVKKLVMVHRLGYVPINEEAVVIMVATAHRKDGFEACQFGIDRLKATVPIWKKEFFKDGTEWIQPNP